MIKFNFVKKQLNFISKWRAAVAVPGTTVTSESLTSQLMCRYSYKRKQLREFEENLKAEIMNELANGNAVEIFGLVKLRPDFSLRHTCTGSESEVNSHMENLTEKDVKSTIKANVNQSFNHEYVRLFNKTILKNLFS